MALTRCCWRKLSSSLRPIVDRRVGKGALAPCPPSINGALPTVGTLPPSLAELRRTRSPCPPYILSRQRVHDHRARHRARLSDQERRELLLDPGQRAPVGLLRAREIVEQADRGHGVVAGIDHV